MDDKIRKALDEAIEKELERIPTFSSDDKSEKSKAIDDLNTLYRLRIEEAKVDLDYAKLQAESAEKEEQRATDIDLKHEQLRDEARDRWINIGVQAGLTIIGWIVYDIWNRRGLKFEETGTVASSTNRNLFSRMVPKK